MSTFTIHTSQGPQRAYRGFLSLAEDRLSIPRAEAHKARGPVSSVAVVPVLRPWDLTLEELAEFDYLLDNAEGLDAEGLQCAWADSGAMFFRYRGDLYDLGEFVRIVRPGSNDNPFCHRDHNGTLAAWDGIRTDSYFSAIVVKYIGDDCELLRVGLYCC